MLRFSWQGCCPSSAVSIPIEGGSVQLFEWLVWAPKRLPNVVILAALSDDPQTGAAGPRRQCPPTPPSGPLIWGLAGVFVSRWRRLDGDTEMIASAGGRPFQLPEVNLRGNLARLYPLGASDGLRKCSACDRLDPGLVNAYIFAHKWPARKPIDQSWWPGWNAMAGKAARAAPMTFTSIRRGQAASSFRGTERFRAGWRVP
jgi:hypothetical protein